MKTPIKILLLLLFLATLIQSCEKSDYLEKSDIQETNGYIDVKIVGKTQDGYNIDESFKAEMIFPGSYESYYEIYDTRKEFSIRRSTDAFKYPSNYVSIDFTVDENNDISAIDIDIDYNKLMDDNKLLDLYIYNNNNDVMITDLEFSEITGKISAKFEFSYRNESSNIIYVTGNFDLNVIQKVRK